MRGGLESPGGHGERDAHQTIGGAEEVQPFTDDNLTAGTSLIRAVQITELRTRIDALRARYGLPLFQWTGGPLVPGMRAAIVALESR